MSHHIRERAAEALPKAGSTTPWRNRARIHFPVRAVAAYDEIRNRWRARREEPRVLAVASWPGVPPARLPKGSRDAVLLASALCREAWSDFPGSIPLAESAPEIVFTENAPALVSVIRTAGATRIEVAADMPAAAGLATDSPEAVRRGMVALLRLGGTFARAIIGGADERAALAAVLDAWRAMSSADRNAISAVLDLPAIDAGHIFGRFLRMTDARGEESDRAITTLLGQARVDLPYDRDEVATLLNASMDPDEARLALYRAVRDYDRAAERENAERIARETAWAEEELLFGRMSRAFHNQALLFAHARYVSITGDMAAAAEDLVAAAEPWPDVRPSADRVRLLVQPGRETPLTELAGALDACEEEALRRQRALAQGSLARRRAQVEIAEPDPDTDSHAGSEIAAIMRTGEAILRATGELRRRLLEAPRRPAAYVVISQRPSPTGAHLLAKINEGEEPYLGKAENLRQLVALAGDRVYASPDYVWLEHANHWIEAIPLFIKERIRVVDGIETAETVIDQEGMEESFREQMADPWARNLRATEVSGWCAVARALLVEPDGVSADLSRQADYPRAWRIAEEDGAATVAALAAAIGIVAEDAAAEIARRFEVDLAAGAAADRLDTLRAVLLSEEAGATWAAVRSAREAGGTWSDAVSSAIAAAGAEKRARYDVLRVEAEPLAALPRRPLPTLHVLTTQSANMTDGYIRSWLEESMALANIVRAHGLESAVKERMDAYRREIETLGAALIDELGLDVEVDTVMAAEDMPRPAAVRRVIGANRLVRRQVGLLAVLREATGTATASLVDPPAVEEIVRAHRETLEKEVLADVVRRNERDIARAVEKLRATEPGADQAVLERTVVEANPDWQADLRAFVRFAARERLLRDFDRESPEAKLRERRESWLRGHQRLALTTARKEVVAERGLSHLTLDPRHFYQAVGGAKRYNLLYTPSRVDLGPRERESVETWAQWVGGRDRQAAMVGRRIYGLINKSVKRFDSLAEPEVLKTGENASMASHFAYSNAMALMVNAAGRGDVEELGDQMSLREDRKIHPAGEGYGGYCVPKDGLFLGFVLTLAEGTKLRQLGIDARWHDRVAALARTVLARRDDFSTEIEWEAWAEGLLADEAAMRNVFSLRAGADGERIPVFQITRIATVLETLGQPPLRESRAVVRNAAARFGIGAMIAGAEHVNRFMPFYKTWLLYDALAEARAAEPGVVPPGEAIIVLTAEYKPDTQDGRFSVGMRKYEILAGTDDHLRYSLGAEAGTLAALVFDGWDAVLAARGIDDFGIRQIAAQHGMDPRKAGDEDALRGVFPGWPKPAEVRLVSPMGLSTQDVLHYTSDTRIEQVADEVRGRLRAAGLADEDIRANMATFGPRIERWAKLRDLPETASLARSIGGRVHALALAVLGPDRSYEHALQGADVFDVGIPHWQVMALVDDPARLRNLMRFGRPASALVIVDGASGARRRAMNRLDVMRWFAACEDAGRRGQYRAIGLGDQTIEDWRLGMRARRDRAAQLRDAWLAGDRAVVDALFRRLLAEVRDEQEALLALEEEERLARFGRDRERDHVSARLLAEFARMDSPASLDFAGWLALGGMFLLDGKPKDDLDRAARDFAAATARLFGLPLAGTGLPLAGVGLPPAGVGANGETRRPVGEIATLAWALVVPARRRAAVGFRQEGGVESSNKATEEVASIALDTRRQLADRARRMMTLRNRFEAYERALPAAGRIDGGPDAVATAVRDTLGAPEEFDSDERYGRVLAETRVLAERLVDALLPAGNGEREYLLARFRSLLTGRQLDPDALRAVSGGYEEIGAVAMLAQVAVERAAREGWTDDRRRAALEEVAGLAELVDVARALDATLADRQRSTGDADAPGLWRRLASFFAETINDHFYEYRPWAYSRGIGFDEYRGDEMYALADRRHRWLYRYVRNLIATRTEARHLLDAQADLLLGRLADDGTVTVAIGAAGGSEPERRWRAYNQLREIAFIRNDGFPLPPVFNRFDPALVDGDNRVNILAMYPVGRTHVSRVVLEGPTLARELVFDAQPAANIILTRLPRVEGRHIVIDDGHLTIDADTYVAALRKHWGLSDAGAEAIARRDVGPKGIRVAVRFTRPVRIAVVLPMHGNPIYDTGALEKLGLPYSTQSRFHTWTTYDKAKYPDIFPPETGVVIPDEIDWLARWSAGYADEDDALRAIRDGRPESDWRGLVAFARRHRVVMIKDAAESGGRNAKAFELGAATGELVEPTIDEAARFIRQIARHHNVAVQEVIVSSPEAWASEEFLRRFADRQIADWHRPIVRDRQPQTPLFGSLRLILSTDRPLAADRHLHWHPSHRITLNSTQLITNVGRGGTLDILRPSDIRTEHRDAILDALDAAGRNAMEALAAYEAKAAATYEKETGEKVGTDLTGVSYGVPRYMMLDFLVRPIFVRPGEVVEVVPVVGAAGERTGSRFVLHDGTGAFDGEIAGWEVVLIEPNIGIGLWDRVAIREEEHERQRAAESGAPMDWSRVGENARIVLRDWTRAGADYLAASARRETNGAP